MTMLTLEDARRIEKEAGLSWGSVAYDREMSAAEEMYLEVPTTTSLALHVELFGVRPALVIFEQTIGQVSNPYLFCRGHANQEEAAHEVRQIWAGLLMARLHGMTDLLGEDLSVVFTGWGERATKRDRPRYPWSWSVAPSSIWNVFQGASRHMLLLPRFEPWPTDGEDEPSAEVYMSRLCVDKVVWVHSILFQGTTSLRLMDGAKLLWLSASLSEQPR